MRKFIFLLIAGIFFLLSPPAMATIVYVDFVNGDDGTGDGSAGNPWKTIAFADGGLSGGDEVRVAKTAVQTASDTMTWTNASATVNTTADESGNISVGDAICKTSDFTGLEGWWYVSAIDTTTITLVSKYSGSTETVTTYYLNDADPHADSTLSSGTSTSDRFKITGGWDLTGPTRDGYTYQTYDSTKDTFYVSGPDWIEYAYFVLSDSSTSPSYQPLIFMNSTGTYLHDVYSASNNGDFYLQIFHSVVENIIVTGPSAMYGIHLNASRFTDFTDIYCLSTASTLYNSVRLNAANNNHFDNLNVYSSGNYGLEINNDTHSNYFKNSTFDGATKTGLYIADGRFNVFYGCTFSNNTLYGAYFYYYSYYNRLHNSTFTSNGSGDVQVGNVYMFGTIKGSVITSAGAHTTYYDEGTLSSDTTDARSGTCLKYDPYSTNSANSPYPLGTVKVASTATDLTLKIYMKDDALFNGSVYLMAVQDGEIVGDRTEKTPTTSYVEYTIVVSSADLTLNKYVDLLFMAEGSAGNIFFDDFSWSQ